MITVDIPAGWLTTAPNIYASFSHRTGPEPMLPSYGLPIPYDDRLDGCNVRTMSNRGDLYPAPRVNAASRIRPAIIVGDDDNSPMDRATWNGLLDEAERWSIPLDTLLIGRPLCVAVERYDISNPYAHRLGTTKRLNLVAVQILGDLTKSEVLDARIAEIRSWFA